MTKIIDQQELDIGGLEFTCTACELDIDVSSFLFDTDRSRNSPQTRLAMLVWHEDATLFSGNIPIQMILLTDEDKPTESDSSSTIDTPCVSCETIVNEGYATVGLKCSPSEVTEETQVEFSNSTICPFCSDCAEMYMDVYEFMKKESIDLKTHVI